MGVASTNIENDPDEARLGSPAAGKEGALGQMATQSNAGGGGGSSGALGGLLNKQIGQLEKSRSEKKAVIDEAIKNLSTREAPSGPSSEELFRLMGAFAAPTKTGGFAESLGKVGEVGADIMSKRSSSKSALEDLKTKYKLQGIDVDSEHLKEMIDAQKAMNAENAPSSIYGKTAKDEGLTPGTPAFNARVAELSAADLANKTAKAQGPQLGAFDTKSGNFVGSNGTVIKAAEVKEDRTNRDAMIKLQDQVKLLDPKTIRNADAFFDYTGAGAGGDLAKTIGGKLFPETAKAQSKITAAALNDRLKNLPPGPASDKDIAQAKSTFPGFSNAKNLQDWVDRTNLAIDNYIKRQDAKYGDAQWYGVGQTPGKPSDAGAGANKGDATSDPSGLTPDSKGRFKATPGRPSDAAIPQQGSSQPVASAPKPGAVYKGHKFLGGDPQNKANWEKV